MEHIYILAEGDRWTARLGGRTEVFPSEAAALSACLLHGRSRERAPVTVLLQDPAGCWKVAWSSTQDRRPRRRKNDLRRAPLPALPGRRTEGEAR